MVRIVRFFGFPQILQAKVLLAIYIFYARPFLSAEKLVDSSIQAGNVGIGLLNVDDSRVRIKGLAECERFYLGVDGYRTPPETQLLKMRYRFVNRTVFVEKVRVLRRSPSTRTNLPATLEMIQPNRHRDSDTQNHDSS